MFKALYARTIWLIGISLSAIIICVAWFRYWMPQREEAGFVITNYNAHVAEVRKRDSAIKKKDKAIQDIRVAEMKWANFVETRTPLADTARGGINVNVQPYQLLLDTKRFRNNVQRALNKQLVVGGVKVISGPRIPGVTDQDSPNSIMANYYNYPSVPFPVVIYDLGTVSIRGTYEQIMSHVRAWKSIPRYLAVTHNLTLNGTAPILDATYSLTLVGYIRYDGVHAPVPEGAAPAGNNAPGAGGGAPTGGFGGPQRGAPGRPPLGAPTGGPTGGGAGAPATGISLGPDDN